MDQLDHFLTIVEADTRISAAHISLYVSLWKKWKDIDKMDRYPFSGRTSLIYVKYPGAIPTIKCYGNCMNTGM